jgi:hypothetical protein
MKYLKLFENFKENFIQTVYNAASKVDLLEYEENLKSIDNLDDFIKYIDEEDFDEYYGMYATITETLENMFYYYLNRYKGPLEYDELHEYLVKFPLFKTFDMENFNKKLKKILQLFKPHKFRVFRAIRGKNDEFLYKDQYNDGLMDNDYFTDISFEYFGDIIIENMAEITAKYASKIIGSDIDKYNKFLTSQFQFFDFLKTETIKKLNNYLPKWMTRSESSGLLSMKD